MGLVQGVVNQLINPLAAVGPQEYEAAGEKLVLYSARHGYAHRAHLICELPPKVAAAAMGHSVETHLAAYSKWCGDDVVDDAFERAATRLGR